MTFDFLGFTHYCDRTRLGKFKLGHKTARKKFIQKAKELNQWMKKVRMKTVPKQPKEVEKMSTRQRRFTADFHIHSRFSRATSKEMNIEGLSIYAKMKGIDLLGTGDFTHPGWLSELKEKLIPLNNGLLRHKDTHFIFTTEVSNVYFQSGRTRKIHNIIFAPDFAIVEKLNKALSRFGDLGVDGRPILDLS